MGNALKAASALFLIFTAMAVVSVPVFGFGFQFQFQVGGRKGWTKPDGNKSKTYHEWATQNRFHVGDTLHFKYQDDSVLLVNRTSYESCTMSDPIFEFKDGDTVFWFDRYGFFYFISGKPSHCEAGQRLVVRVMVHSGVDLSYGPTACPSPTEGGDSGGGGSSPDSIWAPPLNATTKLSVASYFLAALGGVFVILHLFV